MFLHVTYFDMFLESYPFASFSFLLDFHLCSNIHCFLLLFGILNTCFVFLLQLSALLSDVGLNIREAHVFSTADGYSLDVFVVDGWHSEVYCLSLSIVGSCIARATGAVFIPHIARLEIQTVQ